jgi:hypothetical protein
MDNDNSFVDASVFLGIHSEDEAVRVACKGFFVERSCAMVTMSLEHVGRCDDVIWRYDRDLQDAYYPFMDNLHTDMRIVRRCYQEHDVRLALSSPRLDGLPMFDRLLLAMVINADGVLHSVNERLLGRSDLPVRAPSTTTEAPFPSKLEQLYQASRRLRLPPVVT